MKGLDTQMIEGESQLSIRQPQISLSKRKQMSTSSDRLLVWAVARWCRPQALVEYQSKSHEFLRALHEVHAKFERLTAIGGKQFIEVPRNLTTLSELIETQV